MDEDGNYVLNDFLWSGSPLKFTFEKPAAESSADIKFTGNIEGDTDPYLLDENGDYMECAVENLVGVDEANTYEGWTWIFYPYACEGGYSYVWRYDMSDSNNVYEYYASLCINGKLTDDSLAPYIYVNFFFNEPAVVEFPENFDVSINSNPEGIEVSQGIEQGVYSINVKGETNNAGVAVTLNVPEGWDGYLYVSDFDTDPGISELSTRANESEWVSIYYLKEDYGFKEGQTVTLPSDGFDHKAQFYLYKGDYADMANMIEVDFCVENPAYQSVIDKINNLTKEFQDAREQILEVNPDFEFGEWSEIIGGSIDEAKNGAMQALMMAYYDDEEYNFTFSGEDIEGMIIEMKKEAFKDYNKAEYEKVVAEIGVAEAKYEAAIEEVNNDYPNFPENVYNEWKEIIGGSIQEAKAGAEQAYNVASEYGELFFFPYSSEEIDGMIEGMKLYASNYAAYDQVIAEIEKLQASYAETLAQIKKDSPDFDTTKWEELINEEINLQLNDVKAALDTANADFATFTYDFDGEKIEVLIAGMLAASKKSGIESIEAEVAAGKAQIFTLDGKQHNAPVKGEVNVIVRENSTSKVFINK